MVDVHNVKAQDMFYFCNVSSGGQSTKVIGRSQTLSVEVGITTILSLTVYECPEPVFTPETARVVGLLRIPIERLAERYSSGIFQQWFNLDTTSDPRTPAGDPQQVVNKFEAAYVEAVADVEKPKICLSVIGSAFEVQRGARQAFSIFVGEDVKTQAGPDLKALIASHKQQAAYIDALYEALRKKNVPSYRPVGNSVQNSTQMGPFGVEKLNPMQPAPQYTGLPSQPSMPPGAVPGMYASGSYPGGSPATPCGGAQMPPPTVPGMSGMYGQPGTPASMGSVKQSAVPSNLMVN